MTTMQRKGSHHKTRELPVGELAVMALLAIAAVALVIGVFFVTSTRASASTASYLRPAVTAVRGLACDWHPVHRIDRYTTWQYVTPRLAAYEHVGRCSKVIAGLNRSVITGEDGHVADVS